MSAMRLFPATEPFASIAVDLLGPLPRTPEGYDYLLVMCDRFTKLTRVAPLKDTTAMDIVSQLLDFWTVVMVSPTPSCRTMDHSLRPSSIRES